MMRAPLVTLLIPVATCFSCGGDAQTVGDREPDAAGSGASGNQTGAGGSGTGGQGAGGGNPVEVPNGSWTLAPDLPGDFVVHGPRFAMHNGVVYVGFGAGDDVGYVYSYSAGQWSKVGPDVNMIPGQYSEVHTIQPRIAPNGDVTIAIVEREKQKSFDKVFFAHLGNDSWSPVTKLSDYGFVYDQVDLLFAENEPVVMYQDYLPDGETAPLVKRKAGNNWQNLGRAEPAGLIDGARYMTLALLPDGSPVVGFSNSVERNGTWVTEPYVAVHDGTWKFLGTGSFADNPAVSAFGVEVATTSAGDVYAAYRTVGSDNRFVSAVVRKYSGGTWTSLPTPNVEQPVEMKLTLSATGAPVLAWISLASDETTSIQVAAFDGDAWKPVGAEITPKTGSIGVDSLSLTRDGDALWLLWVDMVPATTTYAGAVRMARLN